MKGRAIHERKRERSESDGYLLSDFRAHILVLVKAPNFEFETTEVVGVDENHENEAREANEGHGEIGATLHERETKGQHD